MKLPTFQAHSGCTACPLSEREILQSPGLPTRPWDGGLGRRLKPKALLIVGSHPGIEEDSRGTVMVGDCGLRTNEVYVRAHHLDDVADVYLTNALRCAPRDRDTITHGHLVACRQWLDADLAELSAHYREVVILCTGERAIHSVFGEKVSLPRVQQGSVVEIGGRQYPVFATFLAAILQPHNDPSKIMAIREHLLLVWRYLKFGHIPTKVEDLLPPARKLCGDSVPDPGPDAGVIALDVETYACLEGKPPYYEPVYHPAKALHWDKVRPSDLIATVALAWKESDEYRVKVYRMSHRAERDRLIRCLQSQRRLTILGQNIQFDVLYLRAFDPRFRQILSRDNCVLYELQVLNFLQNDQRIERSLKNLSLVLSVADYRDEEVDLRKGERYRSVSDPRLWKYNAKDSLATLCDYEFLVEAIGLWYGSSTHKWSDYCRQWYNDVLWLTIEMSENGVRYDRQKLQRAHDRLTKATEYLRRTASERWQWPLLGDGAGKARERIIPDLLFKWMPPEEPAASRWNRRIKRTKKGKISCGKENVWLLMGRIPPGHPDRGMVIHYRRHNKLAKLISSYTGPLLNTDVTTDHQGSLIGEMAHPSWHCVPSHASDEDDGQGGTSQCRATPRNPALQTHPPVIEDCQCSRFDGGALVRVDESQSEVRTATALCDDQVFGDIYRRAASGEDINVHADTAGEIAGCHATKKTHPKEYHAGKTLNFLTLFLGQAHAFQETCLREVGWDVPLRRCKAIIQRFDRRHPELRRWQRDLIAKAQSDGYIECPLIGASRTYLGEAEETYASTIANQLVQSISALIILSAQIEMAEWLADRKMRSLVVSNTYDEGIFDCPPDEVEAVAEKAREVFRRPRLWQDLIAGGFIVDVPLDCDVKIVYNDASRGREPTCVKTSKVGRKAPRLRRADRGDRGGSDSVAIRRPAAGRGTVPSRRSQHRRRAGQDHRTPRRNRRSPTSDSRRRSPDKRTPTRTGEHRS